MKRRGFLSLLGIGSVGLALAPKKQSEAEPVLCHSREEFRRNINEGIARSGYDNCMPSSEALYPLGAIVTNADGAIRQYRFEENLYGWYYVEGSMKWPK